jgi:hypothetical protein
MHDRVRNFPKRLGQHARAFGQQAGTALDNVVGQVHRITKNLDPEVAGAIGGALGHDASAITKSVRRAKTGVASYEELRRGAVGARA